MKRLDGLRRMPRLTLVVVVIGLFLVAAAVALAAAPPNLTFTPSSEGQITNIDVLRAQIKNYYGDSGASTGSSATGGWTHPLNLDSNYANEARSVAKQGSGWIAARSNVPNRAIVLDVDDTTLTTWNYELFSGWDFNAATNANFVGLTGTTFTGNLFPATPGMVDVVKQAKALGYAVFFLTGRGDAQHAATIANLVSDTAAGFSDITTVNYSGATGLPEIDAGYEMPTTIDIGHPSPTHFTDGLFTKPAVGQYPGYLNTPEFCADAIAHAVSCQTIRYKSGTRAYIESQGYDIVANFGDQFSDLTGGFADKTFKMPNPNYFLP
jgi:predicted secreted acid phosphatase